MTSLPPEQEPGAIWQGQDTELPSPSIAEVRLNALRYMKEARRDLVARSAFAIVAAVFCAIVFWKSNSAAGWISGFVMLMLLANTARNLHIQRWKARQMSPDISSGMAQTSCLEFYRTELERQRELVRQPAWQLLTTLLVIAWLTRRSPMRPGMDVLRYVQPLVLIAAAMIVVLLAVRKLDSRRIQKDLDALDTFEEEQE